MSRTSASLYSVAFAAVGLLLGGAIHIFTTWEFPTLDQPAEDAERRQHLEEMSRTSIQRLEAVRELLAGKRTLPETASRFRQLTAECSFDTMRNLRTRYPGYSDNELHYLHVLTFIEPNPSRWGVSEDVVKSLRAEFEHHRISDGCSLPVTDETARD